DIREPVVVPDRSVHVFDRIVLGLRAEIARPLRPFGTTGRDHPAAAARHDLVAVEAQAGDVGVLADRPALVQGAERFGRVLDDHEIPLTSDPDDRLEIAGMAEDIDGKYRFDAPPGRAIPQRALAPFAAAFDKVGDALWIHLPVRRLDVDEHRPGAQ